MLNARLWNGNFFIKPYLQKYSVSLIRKHYLRVVNLTFNIKHDYFPTIFLKASTISVAFERNISTSSVENTVIGW